MKLIRTERILSRLEQLFSEIDTARWLHYRDRLREFARYCEATPVLANCLDGLPKTEFDLTLDWREWEKTWPPGEAGYAYRWSAIKQVVDSGSSDWLIVGPLASSHGSEYSLGSFTQMFVYPLLNYLADQVQQSGEMLYTLLRYKRWGEWFQADTLRRIYEAKGEDGLDRNLRRFLFESGIDYPYSEPRSPGGRADIVAELDTDDPLVLEVKVWDSEKQYGQDRLCDGLRQVIDYADKYGKDRGYVAVFNLDRKPLALVSDPSAEEWPPLLERGGKTYYFIAIEIAQQTEPVSQRDRGKPVEVNQIDLAELWAESTKSMD